MQVPEQLREVAEEVALTGRPRKAKVRTLLGWFGHQRRGEKVVLTIRRALQETGLRTEPEFDDYDAVNVDTYLKLTVDSDQARAEPGSRGSEPGGREPPGQAAEKEVEGLEESGSWGDYPIDDLLIRQETRTVYEVVRRINKGFYVMNFAGRRRPGFWSCCGFRTGLPRPSMRMAAGAVRVTGSSETTSRATTPCFRTRPGQRSGNSGRS